MFVKNYLTVCYWTIFWTIFGPFFGTNLKGERKVLSISTIMLRMTRGRGSISASGFGPGGSIPLGHRHLRDAKRYRWFHTICPTHRCWVESWLVVPKEVSGHCKGRVKSIPKADKGIGKHVLQIVLKMSGKLIQPGFGKKATHHREHNYASRQT